MPRARLLAVALAVILLGGAAGGAYGIWYLFLKPGGPPPVALSSATPASPVGATATVSGASPGGADRTWTVDASIGSFADFTDSFVGYRVQEQLASIGASTAVGRTPDVSGSLSIDGTSVTAAEIAANLASLASDDDRRDGQLRRQGIETDSYRRPRSP